MTITWLTVCIFVSVSIAALAVSLLIYEWFLRYRLSVRERLQELSPQAKSESVSLFKDLKQIDTPHAFQYPNAIERLQHIIDQSGTECTVSLLFGFSFCLAAASGAIGMIYSPWTAALLVPISFLGPFLVILQRRRTRIRKLSRQLPEAFSLISRAVRSGQTVPAALRIIAEDFDPPISTEFALCYEQQNLGISRETALRKLATRSNIMELQIFVVALLVQARSGGNLVELLENLAAMIRKRLSMTDRVRALTGEGRVQAMVLIVLPVAVLVGIIVFAPEYASELLKRPWLLAGTAVAQALGAFWIRRVVNFQY
jgi:tight adherence protein B